MEKLTIYEAGRFKLRPDREEVFGWLRCSESTACRPAFENAWPLAEYLMQEKIVPRACVLRENDTLTLLLSLGKEAEAEASRLFSHREYILGSLLNMMCDELLFQMDEQAAALLRESLAEEGLYIASRLEPGFGLTLTEQRRILPRLRAAVPEAALSESGVLFPAKSMMYRILLTREPCVNATLHDCTRCSQTDCPYRSHRK